MNISTLKTLYLKNINTHTLFPKPFNKENTIIVPTNIIFHQQVYVFISKKYQFFLNRKTYFILISIPILLHNEKNVSIIVLSENSLIVTLMAPLKPICHNYYPKPLFDIHLFRVVTIAYVKILWFCTNIHIPQLLRIISFNDTELAHSREKSLSCIVYLYYV